MEILDCVEKTQVIAGICVAEDVRGPGNSGQHGKLCSSGGAVPQDVVPALWCRRH